MPLLDFAGSEPRFYLWRIIAEWGAGVSYLNRLALPKPRPSVKPGAWSFLRSSHSADRHRAADGAEGGSHQCDGRCHPLVLRYAEQWLMVSVEDPEVAVYFASPLSGSDYQAWKLRITYEPQ